MYLRQGVVVNVEDQESMNLEGMVTVPPKVESDDPFSNSNDDEDSFFNDNEDSEDDFFNDDDDEDNTWGWFSIQKCSINIIIPTTYSSSTQIQYLCLIIIPKKYFLGGELWGGGDIVVQQ